MIVILTLVIADDSKANTLIFAWVSNLWLLCSNYFPQGDPGERGEKVRHFTSFVVVLFWITCLENRQCTESKFKNKKPQLLPRTWAALCSLSEGQIIPTNGSYWSVISAVGLVTECSDRVLKAAQLSNQATNPNCGQSQKMMSLSE